MICTSVPEIPSVVSLLGSVTVLAASILLSLKRPLPVDTIEAPENEVDLEGTKQHSSSVRSETV